MSTRTALVTGASSGIGKAIANQLLDNGLTVYVAARRTEKMQDLGARGAHVLKMDITIDDDIVRVVDTITEQHGGIDVLVNNAGYGSYGAVEDTPIDEARHQFEVNLFGLARLTQLALPYMREQRKGHIVNISSVGGKIYTPMGAWYHATKHALEGWSDCLRLELEPFGINVVIVEPGLIKTEFGDTVQEKISARSLDGPYHEMAKAISEATRGSYETGNASPPSVIAKVVSKAVSKSRPRTRYAAGKLAKPLLFMRRWVSDRMFDKAVMSQVKSLK